MRQAYLLEGLKGMVVKAARILLHVCRVAACDQPRLGVVGAIQGHHLVPLGTPKGQALGLIHPITHQRIPAADDVGRWLCTNDEGGCWAVASQAQLVLNPSVQCNRISVILPELALEGLRCSKKKYRGLSTS